MSLDIQKNELHYYVDLLRIRDSKQRSMKQTASCVKALHNTIRTMKFARHDKICGENFTCLDWGNIPFNGTHFSLNGDFPCDFSGCRLNEWSFMSGHSGGVTVIKRIPDSDTLLTGSKDGNVILWSLETNLMLIKLQGHSGAINSIAISSDGSFCLTGSSDHTIKLWDLHSGQCIQTFCGHDAPVISIDFLLDDRFCISCSSDRTIKKWDATTGKCCDTIILGDLIIGRSKDEQYIIKKHEKNSAIVMRRESSMILCELSGHTNTVDTASFSIDNKFCVTGSHDCTARIWNMETGNCEHIFVGHRRPVIAVAISKSKRFIITASLDKTVKLWSLESKKCIRTFNANEDIIDSVLFSPDERLCVACYHNGKSISWNIQSGESSTLHTIRSPRNSFTLCSAIIFEDGQRCLTCTKEAVELWDVENNYETIKIEDVNGTIENIAISSDDKYCLVALSSKIAKLYDLASGKCLHIFETHKSTILCCVFSPDVKHCATLSFDGTINIWNIDSGECEWIHTVDKAFPTVVAYSFDGKEIMIGLSSGMVEIYNSIGNLTNKLCNNIYGILCTSISDNGLYFAVGLYDNTARIYETSSWKCLRILDGHSDWVTCVDLSSDGKKCITGSWDGTAKVWDVRTGECISTSPCSKKGMESVKFSPDGRMCLISSRDSTGIWDIDLENIILDLPRWVDVCKISSDNKSGYLAEHRPLGKESSIALFEIQSKKVLQRFNFDVKRIEDVVFSFSGSFFLTLYRDDYYKNIVQLWSKDLTNSICNLIFDEHVSEISFSSDDRFFIVGLENGTAQIHETKSGKISKVCTTLSEKDSFSRAYWCFPYVVLERSGFLEVYKSRWSSNKHKSLIINKITRFVPDICANQGRIYTISRVFFENCNFAETYKNNSTYEILNQYGKVSLDEP